MMTGRIRIMENLSRVTTEFQAQLLIDIRSTNPNLEDFHDLIRANKFNDHPKKDIESIDIKFDSDTLKKLDVVKKVKTGKLDASKSDERNCKIIYNSLKNLTLQDASDVRIWIYLTLFVCLKYTKARWGYDREISEKKLKERFVANSPQVARYRNSIGSLWWAGYLLNQKSVSQDYSFEHACKIFFRNTQIPFLVIGYPDLMSFENLFAGVLRLIEAEKDFENAKTTILEDKAIKSIKNDPSYKPKSDDYKNKCDQFFYNLNVACNGFNVHMMDKKELDSFFKSIYDNP